MPQEKDFLCVQSIRLHVIHQRKPAVLRTGPRRSTETSDVNNSHQALDLTFVNCQ